MNLEERIYLTVADIQRIGNFSKATAYAFMRELRNALLRSGEISNVYPKEIIPTQAALEAMACTSRRKEAVNAI